MQKNFNWDFNAEEKVVTDYGNFNIGPKEYDFYCVSTTLTALFSEKMDFLE